MPIISQESTNSSSLNKKEVNTKPVCKDDLLKELQKVKKDVNRLKNIVHTKLLKYDYNKKIKTLDDLSDMYHRAHLDTLDSIQSLNDMIESIPTERE